MVSSVGKLCLSYTRCENRQRRRRGVRRLTAGPEAGIRGLGALQEASSEGLGYSLGPGGPQVRGQEIRRFRRWVGGFTGS